MNTGQRRIVAAGAVLALSLLGAGLVAGLRTSSGSAKSGLPTVVLDQPATDLVGSALDGSHFDLISYRGSIVVVNVWASWCGPCLSELPLLAAAARSWSAEGVVVVGLNVRDAEESARQALEQAGATSLINVSDPTGELAVAWGARGVPETFVVDRAGRLRLWAQGVIDATWLRERVAPMVQP